LETLMSTETETIILKWGTLKGWSGIHREATIAALERYHEEPTAFGAAQQRDTPTQKQAICDAIDSADEAYNDWDDRVMTKEEAKKYVLEYGT